MLTVHRLTDALRAKWDRARHLIPGDNVRLARRMYRVVNVHRDDTGVWVQVDPTPPGELDPVRWYDWTELD